jgi:hypothetical protein
MSERSLTEPLESLGVSGQFLVEHAIQQVGTAVILDVLADGLASHILHLAVLDVGTAP